MRDEDQRGIFIARVISKVICLLKAEIVRNDRGIEIKVKVEVKVRIEILIDPSEVTDVLSMDRKIAGRNPALRPPGVMSHATGLMSHSGSRIWHGADVISHDVGVMSQHADATSECS